MSEQGFSLSQSQHFGTLNRGRASEPHTACNLDKAVLELNSLYGTENAGFDPMEYTMSFDDLSQYSFEDTAFSLEPASSTNSSQGSSAVNPADLWKQPDQRLGSFDTDNWCYTSPPQLSQSAAVNEHNGKGRADSVHTPQVDFKPVGWSVPAPQQASKQQQQPHEEDDASHERVQRARNAANKRHSMAKTARSDSGGSEVSVDEQSETRDPKLGRYREKNRIAAGRCRAKKKSHVEDLQTRYARESARHAHLKNEVLELRNTLTFLRDCSLQHQPSGCECDTLRRYNLAQAQKVAGAS